MDLSIVILTWNSEQYIKKCLVSCAKKCGSEGINVEIIIIDNGSSDRTKKIICNLYEKLNIFIDLIELSENRGTTFTRNLGLKKSTGKYICILDSDTEFGSGSLTNVLKRLEKDRQIGIIAPKLILPDGSTQHSVKLFPTFFQKMQKIPKVLFGLNISERDFYSNFPFSEETEVNSAISACWLFRRELIDEIGYLDEKIFYSPEDLDYCLRVHQAGKKILYYPQLEVLHHTQQITHRKPFSQVSISHFAGLLYYYRKHGGWFDKNYFYGETK